MLSVMNLFIDRCPRRVALTAESGPTVPRARPCLVRFHSCINLIKYVESAVELQPHVQYMSHLLNHVLPFAKNGKSKNW